MPWPIRFIEQPVLHVRHPESGSVYYDGTVDFSKLIVGDCCFYHYQGRPCLDPVHLARLHLTAHYRQHNASRPPLILALPDHASDRPLYFLADGQCYSNTCTRCGLRVGGKCKCTGEWTPKGHYDGWTVAGAPPQITVSPSVNYDTEQTRHYHGFIKDGVIGNG